MIPEVVSFFQAGVLFLQRECEILVQIYAFFGVLLQAYIMRWCVKISKFQVWPRHYPIIMMYPPPCREPLWPSLHWGAAS